jgi:hypothetical protein
MAVKLLCVTIGEFALLLLGLKAFLLDWRISPIASAALPLFSCSALVANEVRASLSHQNSHARESRERPACESRGALVGFEPCDDSLKRSFRPAAL